MLHPGIWSADVLRRAYPLIQGLNVLGAAYGLVWYWPQLVQTHLLLLPFVPDCPLAAGLLALALWRWRKGHGEALQGFAIGVALFYGAWTVALLSRTGLVEGLEDRAMLLAHLGMMVEALMLWQVARPHRGWRLAALWVAVNTFVDYSLGTHPALPAAVQAQEVALLTAVAAVAFVLAAPVLDPAS
ncbi:MAG: DUF1405 domain-containing protein [Thermaerobacter sp.]|nr:DUF1405 domain-containing protein [Thermaerobacter sp.]